MGLFFKILRRIDWYVYKDKAQEYGFFTTIWLLTGAIPHFCTHLAYNKTIGFLEWLDKKLKVSDS